MTDEERIARLELLSEGMRAYAATGADGDALRWLLADWRRLKAGKLTPEEIHEICHDLHGTVDADRFAEGCAAEQRKLYGAAPHADRLAYCERYASYNYRHKCFVLEIPAKPGQTFAQAIDADIPEWKARRQAEQAAQDAPESTIVPREAMGRPMREVQAAEFLVALATTATASVAEVLGEKGAFVLAYRTAFAVATPDQVAKLKEAKEVLRRHHKLEG